MEPQLVFNASGNSCAPELGQVPDSQPGPGTFPALHPGGFSAPVVALLATLMALLVLTTVLGNALVILAFVVERSLRTQGNFFFLNLAIADLLVGEYEDQAETAGMGRQAVSAGS
ncbi:histamine H3 receptor-like [Antechinus flavipes]|uniref:histamine H3 receptor-like n=1 Tax=Antechinus flavipes TaxID=38775 RepID=UPI002236753E|nr:histamine H3 receptor-like [Antechinus flavipes]